MLKGIYKMVNLVTHFIRNDSFLKTPEKWEGRNEIDKEKGMGKGRRSGEGWGWDSYQWGADKLTPATNYAG